MSKRSIYFKFKELTYSDKIYQKYMIGVDSIKEIDPYWYNAIEEVIPRSAWRRGVYKIRRNKFLSRGTSYLTYFKGKWYSCWEYGLYDWIHPPYPTAAELSAMRVLGHSKLSRDASYCLSYWNWYWEIRSIKSDVRKAKLRLRRRKLCQV